MPYGTTHAPPWFDATQQWEPATADAPPILNDVNKEPRELPQIVIDAITGWYDRADFIDNRAGRSAGPGEIKYPGRLIGKTLVYECRIEADGRLDFMETIASLQAGFDEDAEGEMTITPWAPFAGSVTWTFTAAVLALAFDKKPVLSGGPVIYEWPFVLTLRMSDVQFYSAGGGS